MLMSRLLSDYFMAYILDHVLLQDRKKVSFFVALVLNK